MRRSPRSRRSRSWRVAALVAPGAAVLVPTAVAAGAPISRAPSLGSQAGVASRRLPSSISYSGLALSPSGLVLSGIGSQAGNPSECVRASLDPATLALSHLLEVSCLAPRPGGPPYQVASVPVHAFQEDVHVVHLSSDGKNLVLGPVVMTHGEYSDTRLVTAYGPSSLWIYDVDAKGGAEVVRVSAATGKVVQRVHLPKIVRPVMAADDHGLYLAPSIEGGCSGACPRGTIFHLGLTSHHLVAAYTSPSERTRASWMVASGEGVWADLCSYGQRQPTCRITAFGGADLHPRYAVSDHGLAFGGVFGTPGAGLFTMAVVDRAGRSTDRVGHGHQAILRIDPANGALSTLATIRIPSTYADDGLLPGQAVVDGNDLYLLDGSQGQDSPGLGFARLYRIPLGAHGPLAVSSKAPPGRPGPPPRSTRAGWSPPIPLSTRIDALSCASERACMGVGATDGRNLSVALRAGRPQPALSMDSYDGVPISLSCPSATRCVALQDTMVTATFDGRRWTTSPAIDHNPSTPYPGITGALSCPTTRRCVAVDGDGDAVVLTGRRWSAPIRIDQTLYPLNALSCPSASFCVAVDGGGRALTFNGHRWSAPTLVAPDALTSVACPTTTFCVAGDLGGGIVTYDGATWSRQLPVDPSGGGITSIACETSGSCVAVDAVGAVVDLQKGRWGTPLLIDPHHGGLVALACAGSRCVATDATGDALVDPRAFEPQASPR